VADPFRPRQTKTELREQAVEAVASYSGPITHCAPSAGCRDERSWLMGRPARIFEEPALLEARGERIGFTFRHAY
jgi:hypothetical protein